jgi:hypothetical protein
MKDELHQYCLDRAPKPFNEDPLLGFNEAAKRSRCVVTIRYPDGRTAQWVSEGLPERRSQLTCTDGENMTLKFYCPPSKPLVRFRRYRRGQ